MRNGSVVVSRMVLSENGQRVLVCCRLQIVKTQIEVAGKASYSGDYCPVSALRYEPLPSIGKLLIKFVAFAALSKHIQHDARTIRAFSERSLGSYVGNNRLRDINENREMRLGWQFLPTRFYALLAREAAEAITITLCRLTLVLVLLVIRRGEGLERPVLGCVLDGGHVLAERTSVTWCRQVQVIRPMVSSSLLEVWVKLMKQTLTTLGLRPKAVYVVTVDL